MDILREYANQILRGPELSPRYEGRLDRPVERSADAPKVICFYLPQFHEIPENNSWWGEGFTEWTNVTRAVPQYLGHEQPKLPGGLGFYDLSQPSAIQRQIALARHYGIYGFCFYYYWFSGRRILEKPLDLFLRGDDQSFPFCICWANEDWTRGWNDSGEVLLHQDHANEDRDQFALDTAPILRDPRYIRVGGKPLLLIYRPALIPSFPDRLNNWREVFRREGVGEVAVYMVQSFALYDPTEWSCDGAVEFPPHNIGFHDNPSVAGNFAIVNPDYSGAIVMAETVLDRARRSPSEDLGHAWIRGCNPSWDNEARRPGRGWTMHGADPDFFERWLRYLANQGKPSAERNRESYLFVNAWNEWAEGAYLEPDQRYGYAYLNRIARVLATKE